MRSPAFWTEDFIFSYYINRLPSIGKEQKRVSKILISHICIQPAEILNDSWTSDKLRRPMSHLATDLLGTLKQVLGAPAHWMKRIWLGAPPAGSPRAEP